MSDFTPIASAFGRRELPPDMVDAVEDALETARAWRDGELDTGQALTIATATPRAIGWAFASHWHDPRRPALEALHAVRYGRTFDMVYTTFGWLHRQQFDMIQRQMAYRAAGAWHDGEAAA